MKRLEREILLADRAAVANLLQEVADDDPAGKHSFGSRLEEIDEQLKGLADLHETAGGVALMFGGGPVHGSRSIDAEFAATLISVFQDLVSKRVAADEAGTLGARGPIRGHAGSNLAITEIMRGSVGFLLEEGSPQQELDDTPLKKAIGDVTRVIEGTVSNQDEDFERAMENLDHRSLVSLKAFFKALDDARATIRIVDEERDQSLDTQAIERGRRRIEDTEIEDTESEQLVGELIGLLPGRRWFELRLPGTDEIISGRVAASLAPHYLAMIESTSEAIVGRWWRTKMKIREVRERNKPPRKLYTLVGLLEQIQKGEGQ